MPTSITPLYVALLFLLFLAPGTTTFAQVQLVQNDGSMIEMSAEQFTALVGKMQRLRAERVQQIAYARQQQQAQLNAMSAQQPAPAERSTATAPPRTNAAPADPMAEQRLRALERQTADLTEEIRLLRNQLTTDPATVRTQSLVASPPRDTQVNRLELRNPTTTDTRSLTSTQIDERTQRLERQMTDERERYERDLRDERERSQRLERDLSDARNANQNDRNNDRNRSRDRDINVNVPAVIPVPAGKTRVDTVIRTVEVGRSADTILMRQQDSLQRALAALQLEMQRRNRTDTVIVERATAPTIIRDTVRSTQVLTRTVVEDRIDLAAVLFANASSQLDAAAEAQVQQALEAYRRESDATILLRGFASKTGNAAFNQTLSTRRATAVRDRLTTLGVPATQIRVIGNGVDDGTSLALARRVEIQLLRKPN